MIRGLWFIYTGLSGWGHHYADESQQHVVLRSSAFCSLQNKYNNVHLPPSPPLPPPGGEPSPGAARSRGEGAGPGGRGGPGGGAMRSVALRVFSINTFGFVCLVDFIFKRHRKVLFVKLHICIYMYTARGVSRCPGVRAETPLV